MCCVLCAHVLFSLDVCCVLCAHVLFHWFDLMCGMFCVHMYCFTGLI